MTLNINGLGNSISAMTRWMRQGFSQHGERLDALEENIKIGSYALNQAEFDATVNSTPSQEVIFNTWHRFSHGASLTFPFLPEETLAWALNPDGSIRNTTNSVSWIGLVSPKKYKRFVLDVDVWSTDGDDDSVGLTACFHKDPVTGYESIISVTRSTGGTQLYSVYYNPSQFPNGGEKRLMQGASRVKWGNGQPGTMNKEEAGQGNNDPGWGTVAARRGGDATGKIRIRVTRDDDLLTFQTSDWNNPDTLIPESLLTLDLKSDVILEKFREGANYGFIAASQKDSYWNVREFSNPNDAIYRLDTGAAYSNINGKWVVDPSIKIEDLGKKVMLINPYTKKAFYMEDRSQIVRMPTIG